MKPIKGVEINSLKHTLLSIIKLYASEFDYSAKNFYEWSTDYLENNYLNKIINEDDEIKKEQYNKIFEYLKTEEANKFIKKYIRKNIKKYRIELGAISKITFKELKKNQVHYLFKKMQKKAVTNIRCPKCGNELYCDIHNNKKFLVCDTCDKRYYKKYLLKVARK
jgi:hypothetical protein